MFGNRNVRIFSIVLAVTMLVVSVVGVANAGSYTTQSVVLASAPSPFANCTVGAAGGSVSYVNAEVEPFVAVNPTNPYNIIGVYQQDRWSDGGARGLTTAYSSNGGATWGFTSAHFSTCSGGTAANGGGYDRTSDPWVTFGPDGVAYQISISLNVSDATNVVLASRSTDGGATWSDPATLIKDTSPFNFNDKESITADPTRAGSVYAVWDRSRIPSDTANFNALRSFSFRGDIMFARTTDGGLTWEPARAIYHPKSLDFTIGNQIVVLPDGTLVDIFTDFKGSGINAPGVFLEIIRSTDHGSSWSQPIVIDNIRPAAVSDPDNGFRVRTGDIIPEIGVDSNTGRLYAVWQDNRFSGGAHSDVAFSQSSDGGLTWSAAVRINQTTNNAAAFTPAVRVASDGTLGVSYYDFRNNTSAPGLTTDSWFVHCHADCTNPANWSENHISGPFDMETAPFARGFFVGDYEGLANIGNRFVSFAVMANSGNLTNRTDVFFANVGP
ncbi:MAG TPA: sialidase family protein [Anaerolineales bacterium]|jgi:hypothetical protein